jgi:hypothetical protein
MWIDVIDYNWIEFKDEAIEAEPEVDISLIV